MVSLGEGTFEPPPPPTWREFFIGQGITHQTEKDAEAIWADHLIWPKDYDKPVCEDYWWHRFEVVDGPCAKAYHLLRSIDIGPEIESARRPRLVFHRGDLTSPTSIWVTAVDQLSLSLLQVRLIDLKMPIKVVEGT
jgi:hypothetical protein